MLDKFWTILMELLSLGIVGYLLAFFWFVTVFTGIVNKFKTKNVE